MTNTNMNKAEMNDAMLEQVNGGYIWEAVTWVQPQPDGQPAKHYKFADYGVEIEEHYFTPNIYRINGTEVSFKNAFDYAKARRNGTV